ncbi:AI-2E family transporter [Lactococcus fujiensis]|uniref:Permease n=1 Tax=Lactococcus fujiensis JCM 16395 TaxID=1291764 RepID=A0A2A5RN83_9LACT|nr:AI-2E family transporter [Lactococcus fujiensis]PCS00791.1 permease [Lactococcus fujiensis JCM 16395]
MFKQSKLFFWTIEILAVALLIFLLTKIGFIFQPVRTLLALLFIPFIIAGFLYYIFNPLVQLLERKFKVNRSLSALLVIVIIFAVLFFVIASIIPNIINQLTSLITATGKLFPQIKDWVESLATNPRFSDLYKQVDANSLLDKVNISYVDILHNLLNNITISIGSVVGVVSSIVMVLILVPILLFYMIKDGEKVIPFLREHVLIEDKLNIFELLENMNHTISRYISGVALDALLVFVVVFIGYSILGIPYAFLFAIFAGITNIIPYAGPYIGVLPMIFTVVIDRPWTAVFATAYVLILQQIDGNVVYPKIIGNAIKIHPVTVMVLMLISGSLYGIVGMIIAVPTYSLVKEIVKFVNSLYRNHQKQKKIQIIDRNVL